METGLVGVERVAQVEGTEYVNIKRRERMIAFGCFSKIRVYSVSL